MKLQSALIIPKKCHYYSIKVKGHSSGSFKEEGVLLPPYFFIYLTRLKACVCERVVCVCVRDSMCVYFCACERASESVCEREREKVCARARVCVCMCTCVHLVLVVTMESYRCV